MVDFAAVDTTQESVLDLIARTIVDRLQPRRVILIGSRARGARYAVTMRYGPFKANEQIARGALSAAERIAAVDDV